jgi:hypothetical protein
MFAVSEDVNFDGKVFQILLMFDLTYFRCCQYPCLLMLSLWERRIWSEQLTGQTDDTDLKDFAERAVTQFADNQPQIGWILILADVVTHLFALRLSRCVAAEHAIEPLQNGGHGSGHKEQIRSGTDAAPDAGTTSVHQMSERG